MSVCQPPGPDQGYRQLLGSKVPLSITKGCKWNCPDPTARILQAKLFSPLTARKTHGLRCLDHVGSAAFVWTAPDPLSLFGPRRVRWLCLDHVGSAVPVMTSMPRDPQAPRP